jgi:hypothetical protein
MENKIKIASCALFALVLSACSAGAPMPATATPDAYAIQQEQLKARATLEAPTLAVMATETERAWVISQWTATSAAEMTGTAQSWTPTPSQTPTPNMTATAFIWTPTPNYTATVAVAKANAQATAIYGESVTVELAIERQRMMNNLWAVSPWVALVISFGVALTIAFQWSKVRVIRHDASGNAPIVLDVIGGVVTDVSRAFHPSTDTTREAVKALLPVPLEQQAAVTSKAQEADIQRARVGGRMGAPGQTMRGQPLLPAYPLNPATRYRIIPEGDHSQFLNERSIRQMEVDWSDNK